MKTYEIWSEGEPNAWLVGKSKGSSFREACENYAKEHNLCHHFDFDNLTFLDCKLFDNEDEAREFNLCQT